MKKSILDLGKALGRKAQKNIFGGSIYPTMYDERCDEIAENVRVAHCPCRQDSQCGNMTVRSSSGGYTLKPGTCVSGVCVPNLN